MSKRLIGNLNNEVPIPGGFPQVPLPEPDPEAEVVAAALAEHIVDTTPHAVYDNLAEGRFVSSLRNGMA